MEWELLLTLAATTSAGSKCLRPKKGWRGWGTSFWMWRSGCGWK